LFFVLSAVFVGSGLVWRLNAARADFPDSSGNGGGLIAAHKQADAVLSGSSAYAPASEGDRDYVFPDWSLVLAPQDSLGVKNLSPSE